MESFAIKNLSFTYPNRADKTLNNICLTVNQGEFITVCGKSGCGKTTLLRLLKSSLAPFGVTEGEICFKGKPLAEWHSREQTSEIGFVMQSPDNQIVTDKVWHELAFGLESLGYSTSEIRTRVAEMASFFGIQTWFHKKVTELSGGQKQLLNLASVMVMQPSVLILDEPTSQLDPIAAQEFLKTLEKINRELGTTVILTEHRLEDAFPMSDRVIVIDKGEIIADGSPEKTGEILKVKNHHMYHALPTPMRVYSSVENNLPCPLTVRDGRGWLENFAKENPVSADLIPRSKKTEPGDKTVIEAKDVWFRYEKGLPDVVKGLNISIAKGEFFAILGGNGTGKTTALSLISGLNKPYRGEILINGAKISKTNNLYNGVLGVLPQNPQALFVKKTVFLDLMEILSDKKISKQEKEARVSAMATLCEIDSLLDSHPYDLSGGEQQRAALAKVLLKNPEILLLDEPTKGMDAQFKRTFADILLSLKAAGVTVVMVSHDIEFCAEFADRCAMFFDGTVTSVDSPREFFDGKSFYTTSANRMARTVLPHAILAEDIILACGGRVPPMDHKPVKIYTASVQEPEEPKTKEPKQLTPMRIILGSVFVLLFALTNVLAHSGVDLLTLPVIQKADIDLFHLIAIAEIAAAFVCFFPQREFGTDFVQQPRSRRKLTKRSLTAALLILIAIPLTIYTGVFYLQDKKYYFISLLIILETFIPFGMIFESRKPESRELIIISVLCAIAVAGRSAFFMLPQFKPVVALVIISGVCFGGETGFLVGAVTGFVSNFFFGQGPWTPWQMFAFGIIGFLAGVLFRKGLLRKTRLSLSIFGGIATYVIYGGIMNPASLIMSQIKLSWEMILTSYIVGIPFDVIHSVSTAFFLWFISEAMIDKIERIKIKYGLIER